MTAMREKEMLYEEMKDSALFEGIDPAQGLFLMDYLRAHRGTYEKGSMVYSQENETDTFAMILRGTVEMAQYDCWGNRFLILTQGKGTCIGLAGTLFEESNRYSRILYCIALTSLRLQSSILDNICQAYFTFFLDFPEKSMYSIVDNAKEV